LYQDKYANNGQTTNKEVIIPSNETNTISDVSFQQSLQQSSISSTGHFQQNKPFNQVWPTTSHQAFMDHENTLKLLDKYVQDDIFPCLKFISLPEMIVFSWEKDSICQTVCEKINVEKMEQTRFWSLYSKYISQRLNKKDLKFQI